VEREVKKKRIIKGRVYKNTIIYVCIYCILYLLKLPLNSPFSIGEKEGFLSILLIPLAK